MCKGIRSYRSPGPWASKKEQERVHVRICIIKRPQPSLLSSPFPPPPSSGLATLKPGDEIILSVAEHHSNLVPWQIISQRTGAVLKFVGLTKDTQELSMDDLRGRISSKTRLVSLVHVSNALGCVLPGEEGSAGSRVALQVCAASDTS